MLYQPDGLKTESQLRWSSGTGQDVWQLLSACHHGDLATVKSLIGRDAALSRCHFEYRKPIQFAIRRNHLAIVDFLLEHDPNPNGLSFGDTLLDLARDRGFTEMETLLADKMKRHNLGSIEGESVAELIRAGNLTALAAQLQADPEKLHIVDQRGNQPIHWAAMTREAAIFEHLVQQGADPNARRCDGARPIQLANGDYYFRGWQEIPKTHPVTARDMIDLMRSAGATCDLSTACHLGDRGCVEEILKIDPGAANQCADYVTYYPCSGTPIRNAAGAGHLDLVQRLLSAGADPNLPEEGIAPEGQALYLAAAHGHIAIAKLLLEHGAHPNVEVESSGDTLSRVMDPRNQEMLELLYSYGAAQSASMLAYYNGIGTAAAMFHANPDLANDPEALASAANGGHKSFVRLLLKHSPSLPAKLQFPSWATGSKTLEIDEMLFSKGFDPNQANWLGVTPLHELARQGNVTKAALYRQYGAALDVRDIENESTPLGYAAKHGQTEMVSFLIDQGASINEEETPPWATPLSWGRRRRHQSIVDLLTKHGATR